MDTGSAEYVARIGYNALMKGKSLVTSGFPNKVVVFLTRLSPRILNAKVSGWINLGKESRGVRDVPSPPVAGKKMHLN